MEAYRDFWEAACDNFEGRDELQGCKLFHTAMMLHHEVPPPPPRPCIGAHGTQVP